MRVWSSFEPAVPQHLRWTVPTATSPAGVLTTAEANRAGLSAPAAVTGPVVSAAMGGGEKMSTSPPAPTAAFQRDSPETWAVNHAWADAWFLFHSWRRMTSGLVTSNRRMKGPGFLSGELSCTLYDRTRMAPAGLAGGSASGSAAGVRKRGSENDSGSDQPTILPPSTSTNMPRALPEPARSLARSGEAAASGRREIRISYEDEATVGAASTSSWPRVRGTFSWAVFAVNNAMPGEACPAES